MLVEAQVTPVTTAVKILVVVQSQKITYGVALAKAQAKSNVRTMMANLISPKVKCEFNREELNDLWSALSVWQKEIDQKKNPQTTRAIKRLIKKVRGYLNGT